MKRIFTLLIAGLPFMFQANAQMVDATTESLVIEIEQPYWNHNGGGILFGPDGYLYVGMGDGGSGGDPEGYGQNTLSLLGKMLRLDVDNGDGYSIPASNPFVGVNGYAAEIWAVGLRNPWRFSFDKETGDLWIGDVGQNAWEEIDFQAASSNGGENYGWNCYEGDDEYQTNGCGPEANFTFPIHTYVNNGWPYCSVTGGYVYRGTEYPNMQGHYIFADYCAGDLWSIYDNAGSWEHMDHETTSFSISSFGEDHNGELYFTDLGGEVYKIVDNASGTGLPEVSYESFATGLNKPVLVATDGSTYLYVVEQDGVIKQFDLNGNDLGVFLDINEVVSSSADNPGGYDAELGLLGLAFHPDFANNGYFYVNYTDNSQNTKISRFQYEHPTYDCVADACVENVDGMGEYSSLANCHLVCGSSSLEENTAVLSTYPNPVNKNGVVHLGLTAEKHQIQLTDITGKTILKQTIIGNQLSLNGIEAGVYFLQVNDKMQTKILIK